MTINRPRPVFANAQISYTRKKKFKSDKAIASFSIWLFVLMGVYAISIRRLTCAERVSEAEEESGERLISCILSKA